MPNHVKNRIAVRDDNNDNTQLKRIAEFLRPDNKPLGYVDFNKLIPMPKTLDIEAGSRGEAGLKLYKEYLNDKSGIGNKGFSAAKETKELKKLEEKYKKLIQDDPEVFELGKQYYENIKNYGVPTWYEWANRNWGTKWNAYECVPLASQPESITFWTAWSCVEGLAAQLSKQFPDVELEYCWADEDIGNNLGRCVYRNGQLIEMDYGIDGSKEAYEFAAGLWEIDLQAEGYRLSKDGSTYEFCDDVWEAIEPSSLKSENAQSKNKKKSQDILR